jgi:hypothetical protein
MPIVCIFWWAPPAPGRWPQRRDQISHPSHGHDDLSNAIAGAADLALNYTLFDFSLSWVDGAPANETYAQRKQRESDENFRWRLGNYMRSIGAVW